MNIKEFKQQLASVFDQVEIQSVNVNYELDSTEIHFSAHNHDKYLNGTFSVENNPFSKTGDTIDLTDGAVEPSTMTKRIYRFEFDAGIIDDVEHVNDDDTVTITADSLANLWKKTKASVKVFDWPVKTDVNELPATDQFIKALMHSVDWESESNANVNTDELDRMLTHFFVDGHRLTLSQWHQEPLYANLSLFNDINDYDDGDGAEQDLKIDLIVRVGELIARTTR